MHATAVRLLSFIALAITLSRLEAQTLPLTYTGASPLQFTVDANAQLIVLGTFDPQAGSYSPDNLNSIAEGAGTRMVWYPAKAAFRAGYVDSTQWDDGAIGVGSVAFGRDNYNGSNWGIMAGEYNSSDGSDGNNADTVAFGWNNTVYGANAMAMGSSNSALTNFTTAIGENDLSTGYYSSALGQFNSSTGTCSNSFGVSVSAAGTYSTALGNYSTAVADGSSVLGSNCYASSYGETVVGMWNVPEGTPGSWVSTDDIFVVGNGTSGSAESNALVIHKDGTAKFSGAVTVPASGDIPMYTGN